MLKRDILCKKRATKYPLKINNNVKKCSVCFFAEIVGFFSLRNGAFFSCVFFYSNLLGGQRKSDCLQRLFRTLNMLNYLQNFTA